MSRVAVKGSVLRWAVDRSGLPVEFLQKKFPKLREWIGEAGHPTLRQVEALAATTLTPLGYFFLPKPPVESLPMPHFRTLGNGGLYRPSPDLLHTVHQMQRRQLWMRELLIDQGQERLLFVRSSKLSEPATIVADRIRRVLGVDLSWALKQRTMPIIIISLLTGNWHVAFYGIYL